MQSATEDLGLHKAVCCVDLLKSLAEYSSQSCLEVYWHKTFALVSYEEEIGSAWMTSYTGTVQIPDIVPKEHNLCN